MSTGPSGAVPGPHLFRKRDIVKAVAAVMARRARVSRRGSECAAHPARHRVGKCDSCRSFNNAPLAPMLQGVG